MQLSCAGTNEVTMSSYEFNDIVGSVVAKSPLQKKKLERYLAGMDELYFVRAEEFSNKYLGYLDSQCIPMDFAITAYLDMCKSMMKCQIEFMKTGTYTIASQDQAFDEIYSSSERMTPYMIALAISQFLWPTHYRIYEAFENTVRRKTPHVDSYLEVGPGHGLYLSKAIEYLRPETLIHAIDISPISVEISESIIKYIHPDIPNINYWTGDFLTFPLASRYDFITIGEVLEHVNEPYQMLCKLRSLLSDTGTAFVTTSINSPAVDHVYHFKCVDDVREMLYDSGLSIVNEQVLPVEELPMEEIVSRKITINYSAEVERNNGHG